MKKVKVDIEEIKSEAKETIGQLVQQGNTSGNFTIGDYRIAWDLNIEAWEE